MSTGTYSSVKIMAYIKEGEQVRGAQMRALPLSCFTACAACAAVDRHACLSVQASAPPVARTRAFRGAMQGQVPVQLDRQCGFEV